MFTAALFIIVKMWKHPECSSVDEWIKKLSVCVCTCMYVYMQIIYVPICMCVYTHTQWNIIQPYKEYLSQFMNNIESGPRGWWKKSEKDIFCMISLIYGIFKKTNPCTNTHQTQEIRFGYQSGGLGGRLESRQKIQTSICKVKKYCGCNVQRDDYS